MNLKNLEILVNWLKSPKFADASKKVLTRDEAYKLGHYQARLLSTTSHPKEVKPLLIKENYKFEDPRIHAESYVSINNPREIRIGPNATSEDVVHEGVHLSSLNLDLSHPNGKFTLNNLYPSDLKVAAKKQMDNAQNLADLLVIDPIKYKEFIKLLEMNGATEAQAKALANEYIEYLKHPQEVRARGLTYKLLKGSTHPLFLDDGQNFFTNESLNNLYKNIFIVPTALGFGALAVNQE